MPSLISAQCKFQLSLSFGKEQIAFDLNNLISSNQKLACSSLRSCARSIKNNKLTFKDISTNSNPPYIGAKISVFSHYTTLHCTSTPPLGALRAHAFSCLSLQIPGHWTGEQGDRSKLNCSWCWEKSMLVLFSAAKHISRYNFDLIKK